MIAVIAAEPATGFSVTNVVIVLMGAMLLVVFGWSWAGRSDGARWWVGWPEGRGLMLGAVPGLGLLIFTIGLAIVFDLSGPVISPLLAVPLLVGVVLLLAGGLDLLPKWWGPAWFKKLPARRRHPRW
ncbi:MAG TPA: hypothetical protein VF069_00680 [Streptosporangiaceae bacterium]